MVHTDILQEDKNHHSTVSVKEQTSLQKNKKQCEIYILAYLRNMKPSTYFLSDFQIYIYSKSTRQTRKMWVSV